VKFQPYQCLHVPVKGGGGIASAVLPIVLPPFGLYVAYRVFGIMVFIAPIVVGTTAIVLYRRWKSRRKYIVVPMQNWDTTLCVGCQQQSARSNLLVGNHRVAVCDSCLRVATARIKQGVIG
jgi:uncharacterized membrane protein